MNKIILSGNLCKDIEVNHVNDASVIKNTIAVKNDYKNSNGEYDSQFINIVVWRNNAEFLSKYASKGSKVLVEGRLTTRTYEKQDGTKGYAAEVVVDKLELLSNKPKEKTKEEETNDYEDFGDLVLD